MSAVIGYAYSVPFKLAAFIAPSKLASLILLALGTGANTPPAIKLFNWSSGKWKISGPAVTSLNKSSLKLASLCFTNSISNLTSLC